jgi:hypothetical protein
MSIFSVGKAGWSLAEKTFLEEHVITAIINNEISLEKLDFSLLCSVILHCQGNFLTNSEVQERDFQSASMNNEVDDEKI